MNATDFNRLELNRFQRAEEQAPRDGETDLPVNIILIKKYIMVVDIVNSERTDRQ